MLRRLTFTLPLSPVVYQGVCTLGGRHLARNFATYTTPSGSAQALSRNVRRLFASDAHQGLFSNRTTMAIGSIFALCASWMGWKALTSQPRHSDAPSDISTTTTQELSNMRIDSPPPVIPSTNISRTVTASDYSKLADAMLRGDEYTVRALIEKGIKFGRGYWFAPETQALEETMKNHFEIICILLKEGALDPNQMYCWDPRHPPGPGYFILNADPRAESLLTLAVKEGSPEKLRSLIRVFEAKPNSRLSYPKWIDPSLYPGDPYYESLTRDPDFCSSPLTVAIRLDDRDCFDVLFREGTFASEDLDRILGNAVYYWQSPDAPEKANKEYFVTQLLARGADASNVRAICCAIQTNNCEALKLLYQHGARFDYREVLLEAINEPGDSTCLDYLIEHGAAKAANLRNETGKTLLNQSIRGPSCVLEKCLKLGVHNTREEIEAMIAEIKAEKDKPIGQRSWPLIRDCDRKIQMLESLLKP